MPVTAENLIKKHEEGLANNVCLYDAWGTPFQVDKDVQSLIIIDHSHEEIHEGRAFSVSSIVTLAAAAVFNCIITADTLVPHMVMLCSTSNNGVTVTLFEAPVFTGGTPVTPMNRNRRSIKTPTATFVHTPAITVNGTQLMTMHLGASVQSGSTERATEEWILKAGTSYLVNIVADAGATATFSGRMEWYEEFGPLS